MARLPELEKFVAGFSGASSFIRRTGWADLEARLYTKSPGQLSQALSLIKDEFCDDLREIP